MKSQGRSVKRLWESFWVALISILTAVFALTRSGFAQEAEKTPSSDRSPSLAQIPVVEFDSSRYQASAAEVKKINQLIDGLAEIDNIDFAPASMPFVGDFQFVPVPHFRDPHNGLPTNGGSIADSRVTELVSLGPKCLPMLLERIADETPTKVLIRYPDHSDYEWYSCEIPINLAHPTEQKARNEYLDAFDAKVGGFDLESEKQKALHTVTIGDVCFVIVGQIVNRSYQSARFQPSADRVVCSPTHDPRIGKIVQTIWKSSDPAKTVFESLLIDLHTLDADSLVQRGAAMRLLYFFPNESGNLVANRIKTFDLSYPEDFRSREAVNEKNGIDLIYYLEALSLFEQPEIVDALVYVLRHAEDPKIIHASLSDAVVNRESDLAYQRLQEIINERKPSDVGPYDRRYVALRAAIHYFPNKSKALFDAFAGLNEAWTIRTKIAVLEEPNNQQPWMFEFLVSLLDNKTQMYQGSFRYYGKPWDKQPIRVCDIAAKVLADDYLPEFVRFEFEENPAYLDKQITKIRRVIGGEQNISFSPPPRWNMPENLPKRQAKQLADVPSGLGQLYKISNEKEFWAGDVFKGRGGYGRDTIRYDLTKKTIDERIQLDQWKGGISLIGNGPADRAFCYHGYEGGHVLIRDLRTGNVLNTVETPFHNGVKTHDPRQIRNLGDITICGEEGKWILALTDDLALHSIDTEDSEHRIEWKYENDEDKTPLGGKIIGLRGSSKVILEDVGGPNLFDAPIRVWDQSTRTMKVIDKAPNMNWRGGWGDLALNTMYGDTTLWNIEKGEEIELPYSDDAIHAVECDSDQSTLFILRNSGQVDVFQVIDGVRVQPFFRLALPTEDKMESIACFVSADDQNLFWLGLPEVEAEAEPSNRLIVAIFDIGDLTDPAK